MHVQFNSLSSNAENLKLIIFVEFLFWVIKHCKVALSEKKSNMACVQSLAASVTRALPRRSARHAGNTRDSKGDGLFYSMVKKCNSKFKRGRERWLSKGQCCPFPKKALTCSLVSDKNKSESSTQGADSTGNNESYNAEIKLENCNTVNGYCLLQKRN